MCSDYAISRKLTSIPADVVALQDYQRLAADFMPAAVYEYIHSGGADEFTLNSNRSAFDRIKLYNRVLANVSEASTRLQLFGQTFRHPILLAPVAHQKLVHPQGELATAEAANAMQAGFVSSTLSSLPMESIAANLNQPKWFQLYFQSQRDATLALLRRAEAAGFSAIVVTVDVPINGLRNRIQRAGFQMPAFAQSANIKLKNTAEPLQLAADDSVIFQGIMREAANWNDLQWLRSQTDLPILLKGLSHPDDALRAIETGINGIIVSNHGGRGLDGVPASIETLAAIRQALGPDITILLDSGIRRGTDIVKAIALGANAVLIGRPVMDALAVAGALGVAHMIKLLRDELEVSMALIGANSLSDITSTAIYTNKD
jgi:isopentenyl diphosphate isomerase/L-lactate dehydrogenase-like FMN-dependent dehydrogenase